METPTDGQPAIRTHEQPSTSALTQEQTQASGSNVHAAASPPSHANQRNATPTDAAFAEFGRRLASRIAPHIDAGALQEAVLSTIHELRSNEPGWGDGGVDVCNVHTEDRPPAAAAGAEQGKHDNETKADDGQTCKLVYVHSCNNVACASTTCTLCKHNPRKRCLHNFAPKYWVGDIITAKCDAPIEVEMVDCVTGAPCSAAVASGVRIKMMLLNGKKYAQLCREAGEQRVEFLEQCILATNQQGKPLLQAVVGHNSFTPAHAPSFVYTNTPTLSLTNMTITESSESVLQGSKHPPFRMLALAVDHTTGSRIPNIRPAVSEEFVVVTKRTKTLEKQEIPLLEDPINRLHHIGKETVRKLHTLKQAAQDANMDLTLPPDLACIYKVKEFVRLTQVAAGDGHLLQKLRQVLKLSKDKWDAAAKHAASAVQVDNRLRAWYVEDMSAGVLYTATSGNVEIKQPAGLLLVQQQQGAEDIIEVIPVEQLMPSQQTHMQTLAAQAREAWFAEGHPGWMIFTLGGQHFDTLGDIQKGHAGSEKEETKQETRHDTTQNDHGDQQHPPHHAFVGAQGYDGAITAAAYDGAAAAGQPPHGGVPGMQDNLLTALLLHHAAAAAAAGTMTGGPPPSLGPTGPSTTVPTTTLAHPLAFPHSASILQHALGQGLAGAMVGGPMVGVMGGTMSGTSMEDAGAAAALADLRAGGGRDGRGGSAGGGSEKREGAQLSPGVLQLKRARKK